MKRTRAQDQEQQQRREGAARRLTEVELTRVSGGDVYLHNPRGSNDSGSGGSSGSGG
jgi:hypothetical protein